MTTQPSSGSADLGEGPQEPAAHPAATGTACGWFPDPGRVHEARYFDNGAWTGYVHDYTAGGSRGTVSVDELVDPGRFAPPAEGWYPDPDPGYHDGYERYWTGEGWRPPGTALDRRPVGGRAAYDPATRHASAVVRRRYWLACMLPFALSLLLPYLVWRAIPASSTLNVFLAWDLALLLAGWGPYVVGLAGMFMLGGARGEAGAHEWRSGARGSEAKEGGQGKWSVMGLPGSDDWMKRTAVLAGILGSWGVLASFGILVMTVFGAALGGGIGL